MTPLNNKQHANLKIQYANDVSRFQNQNLIPITVQDFIPLSTEFPIIFVKNEDTGQFTSVAMMGIRSGINLYCQDVEWSCAVAPVGFHNAPLSLVKTGENSEEVMVCFDENSPFVSNENGDALFDKEGQQTDFLNRKTQALLNIADFTEQTQAIIGILAKKKLLTSKQLNVKLTSEEEPILLNGIYLIDEKVLNSLPAQEFEELRTQGLLPLIYAQLASLHQITRLTIKQNKFEAK
jgi:hypothetical protein